MYDLEQLARETVAEAARRGVTLATAESLTAGLIAATIADISGASQVLLGGIISYALAVKQSVLGVQGITAETVVSADCARQMAGGASRVTGAALAVSCTGVAGPIGGTEKAPIGTVYIGVAFGGKTWAEEHHFSGDRQAVRQQTVRQALLIVLNCMKGGQ